MTGNNGTGVIWARVSSEEQSAGYSLDAQIRQLREKAEKQGIRVVREFSVAESAKDAEKRRQFKAMLEFLKEKQVGFLIAYEIDRVTRNPHDLSTVYHLIDDNGLRLLLVKDGREISKGSPPSEKLLFSIMGAVSHFDNLQRAEKTRKGMEEKCRQGGYPMRAPIGYLNVPDPGDSLQRRRAIIIDPERALLVRQIFELYATGNHSMATLRDEVNRRGLRTKPTSKLPNSKISKHGLQAILRNPFYYGWFRWSGELWKGSHEPLITKELFDQVQNRLHENVYNSKGDTKKWFAFKPFLKCAFCRCSITAERQKNLVYYRCTFGHGRCKQRYYREEEIDSMFAGALGEFYLDDFIIEKIKEKLKEASLKHDAHEKNELKRLQSLFTQRNNHLSIIYSDRLDEVITVDEYKAKKTEIHEELARIQAEIDKLSKRNFRFREEGSTILEMLRGFKGTYLKQDFQGKAKILQIILKKCWLKGEDTHFEWKQPFDQLFLISEIIKSRQRGE